MDVTSGVRIESESDSVPEISPEVLVVASVVVVVTVGGGAVGD